MLRTLLIQNIDYYYLTLYIIYNWITNKGYSKHELSTINMLYSLKKLVILRPSLPITATFLSFFCPQGDRCTGGSTVLLRKNQHVYDL